MRDQIKLLGILNMIWGGLSVLIAAVALLFMSGIAAVVSGGSGDPDAAKAAPFIALVGVVVGLVLLVIGLPAIIGGWGLFKLKPWSRLFMIVISALHLPNIPFGTALGVYGLVVLLKEEARSLLESGGQLAYTVNPVPAQYPMTPPPPPPSTNY